MRNRSALAVIFVTTAASLPSMGLAQSDPVAVAPRVSAVPRLRSMPNLQWAAPLAIPQECTKLSYDVLEMTMNFTAASN
jgi:hypothetical protein